MFEKVKREIKVLRQFNHPHIIKHFEFIDTSSDIFIVIEYATGGELFDYISKNERVSKFFISIFAYQLRGKKLKIQSSVESDMRILSWPKNCVKLLVVNDH